MLFLRFMLIATCFGLFACVAGMVLYDIYLADELDRLLLRRQKQPVDVALPGEILSLIHIFVIERDHSARIVQHDFVEAGLMRNIAKTRWSLIAEKRDSAFARKRLAHGDQVHPAVVIVIERGDPPGAHPGRHHERDAFKRFSPHVSPHGHGGRRPVRECQIHPAVVIEIGRHDTRRGTRHADCLLYTSG